MNESLLDVVLNKLSDKLVEYTKGLEEMNMLAAMKVAQCEIEIFMLLELLCEADLGEDAKRALVTLKYMAGSDQTTIGVREELTKTIQAIEDI